MLKHPLTFSMSVIRLIVSDIEVIKNAASFIRLSTGYWPGSSWPESKGQNGRDPKRDPLSCYCDGGNTFIYNKSSLIKAKWNGPYMTDWPKNVMGGTYYFDYNQADQNGDGAGNERVLWLDNGRDNSGKRFPDDLKLLSSMTLFDAIQTETALFDSVLEKYFEGNRCRRTISALKNE